MNLIHYKRSACFFSRKRRTSRDKLIKYLAVMKLTIILIIVTLQVSASAIAQQVSLNFKKASLQEVLISIRKQSGYTFVSNASDLEKSNPVTLTLKSSNIDEILQAVFSNQPFDYQVQHKIIMIALKESEKKSSLNSPSTDQQKSISGTVSDEKGESLPGVTVVLKEQNNRISITDGAGRFYFPNAPDHGTLLISMIGKETKKIYFKKEFDLAIILRDVSMMMDQVQIVAYGATAKKYLTSNISSVKGDMIEKAPVSNILLALSGRVPGVFIQQSSGISGNGISVTVQGQNSLNNGNVPFYVVDGVPYSPDVIATGVRGISSGIGSAMGFINPMDIESIEILKDADATAIYGSRAANGAILITTKKGKAGQTKVDINMQSGWGKIATKLDYLKTADYLTLRKEAYANNNNEKPGFTAYDINGTWDQNRYTDWQDVLIGGTSLYQNIQASVSGGTENTQFLVGGGYLRETTVFPDKSADKKGSAHLNLNHNSSDKKFNLNVTVNYLQGTNKLPQTDLTSRIAALAPNAPALYNSDGSINWSQHPAATDFYTFANPIAALNRRYTENTNNLISNTSISYKIVPNMLLKIGMGYNRFETNEVATEPFSAINPAARQGSFREANYATKNIESWISEPQITYNKKFSFGDIEALIGTTFQQSKNNMQSFLGRGYSNDSQLENVRSAPSITATGSLQSVYRYNALFGRLNYRYDDRYIINLTARRDGSSRFGSANLFHNFFAIGTAWIFSNETFFKNSLSFLSLGKIRASYGTTGNDQIGNYQYLNLYSSFDVDRSYQGLVSLAPAGLPNPYLQWEETRKLNLGLDVSLRNDRAMLTLNYFRNRSSNQLLDDQISTVTGFPTITRNMSATVQNTGWEFLLNVMPLKKGKLTINNSVNLTVPRNKLLKYDNLSTNSTYYIGESLASKKIYIYSGVNSQTGLYQFVSSTGDLTSTPNSIDDRTKLVDLNPNWYGGFSSSIRYGNFNLDFLLQYTKRIGSNYRYPSLPGYTVRNMLTNTLNHWTKKGDITELQKFTRNVSEVQPSQSALFESDAVYSDASFARLKNVSLSWTLPSSWSKKAKIDHARLYLQGQNLFTWSNYFGADPETMSQGALPPLRVYTVGIQLSL